MIIKLRLYKNLKDASSYIIFLIDFRLITEVSKKKNVLEKICESKGIVKIYGVHFNSQHQGVVKIFNRTI